MFGISIYGYRKRGVGVKIMQSEKYYKTQTRARVKDDVVLCPHHWKKLARVTPEGIELWCKHEHGHPVLLPYGVILDELKRAK